MEFWGSDQGFAVGLAVVFILITFLGLAVVLILTKYIRRISIERERNNLNHINFQRALVRDSIIIQEKERERIAADLHDSLIGKLNGLRMNLYYAIPENKQILESIEECIKLTRHISHDLTPPLIEESYISEIVSGILQPLRHNYKVILHNSGYAEPALSVPQKLQLTRIIQECVNNSLKHSQATEIQLNLRYGELYLYALYSDNGVGFDLSVHSAGLGMRNITLRTEFLQAAHKINSAPGKGFKLKLIMPLNNISKPYGQ